MALLQTVLGALLEGTARRAGGDGTNCPHLPTRALPLAALLSHQHSGHSNRVPHRPQAWQHAPYLQERSSFFPFFLSPTLFLSQHPDLDRRVSDLQNFSASALLYIAMPFFSVFGFKLISNILFFLPPFPALDVLYKTITELLEIIIHKRRAH